MPAPLRCPTCSAPLDVPPEHATVVRCTYCGAGVMLTERGGQMQASAQQQRHNAAIAEVLGSLRAGSKLDAIRVYREHFGVGLAEAKYAVERLGSGQPGSHAPPAAFSAADPAPMSSRFERSGSRGTMMFGLALAVLAIATFIYFDGPRTVETPAPTPQAAPSFSTPRPPVEEKAGPPAFAEQVMRFGSEGTGAGRFEDARSVTVDGEGRIYVAEYTGGRVQVFDSAGTFITQWMADTRMPLLDLETGRDGTIYVVQSGRIRRYEGATGRALGEVRRPSGASFDDVAPALDGSLWTVSGMHQVSHLSADGRVLKTIDTRQAIDEDAAPVRVAVAGTGDVYVMDRWHGAIYHLGPDGRFRDRFGGRAKDPMGPGMSAPQDLAIDGRGRVYVSDMMGGVHVFDADGRFLAEFATAGIFGIAFDDQDALFASHRNDAQIVKYRVTR